MDEGTATWMKLLHIEGCIEYKYTLIDEIWDRQTTTWKAAAFELEVKYTGKTVAEKLGVDIREKM